MVMTRPTDRQQSACCVRACRHVLNSGVARSRQFRAPMAPKWFMASFQSTLASPSHREAQIRGDMVGMRVADTCGCNRGRQV